MKTKFQEKGQALVVIALAAIVLFGFAALAIDGSRVFSDRRHAQNAADASSVAAALAKIRHNIDYKNTALERASSNGYDNDADSIVEVNLCSENGIICQGLPANADKGEYIRVKITSVVPMTIARVLGWPTMTNVVESIAHAKVPNPNASVFGAGLVAVRNDTSDQCFKVNGNADLTIHDSGIFVNCTGSSALFLNGNADIGMDANAQVAGCANDTNFNIGVGQIACNTPQQSVNASTFANYPTTLPTPVCTSPGTPGTPPSPGYYNTKLNISSNTTLAPGTYCFNAGLNLIAGSSISGTGLVQIVMGGDVSLKGSANSFDQLEIYTANNADFTLHGTLTANRLRFFGNGSSDFGVQGGTLSSWNTYIYSAGGNIDIQAQATVIITAPPSEDPFGGILIHMPWSNTNKFVLNGGTDDRWMGLVLVPHSDVTYNGGAGFELYGQVIGYTMTLNGNGHSNIHYMATTAPPVDAPTISITK